MTSFELDGMIAPERRGTARPFAGIGRLLAAMRLWHDRRRTLARLAGMDGYLLRDAGFDPDDVRDALNGDGAALWSKWAALHGKKVGR